MYLCVKFRNNTTNGHFILQISYRIPYVRLKYFMKPEFLMTVLCPLAAEGLASLAALHSLQLLNYLFHCWRLLAQFYVISELYTCEEQRYLSVRYQDDKFLTKNHMQMRVFMERHEKALTECGTVLSSPVGLQSAFQRSYLRNYVKRNCNCWRFYHL